MFGLFDKKESYKSVHATEIKELLNVCEVIDIREPYEYETGNIPNAKNIPYREIIAKYEEYLDPEKEYLLICQSGARSSRVCRALHQKGFKVINVEGGTSAYKGKLEKKK